MDIEKFSSVADLYNRVLPALKSKRKEFQMNNLGFITEKEIWNYLREKNWSKKANLTLFDIVNDILNMSEKEILEYINLKQKNEG